MRSSSASRSGLVRLLAGIAVAALVTSSALVGRTVASAQETEVHIPDPALREVIEEALGKEPDAPITAADMESLTTLPAVHPFSGQVPFLLGSVRAEGQIKDLTGLEHATQLTEIWLFRSQISELTPLADLTSLTHLVVGESRIADLSPLGGLSSLTHLWLPGNNISDVTPLASLMSLTSVDLRFNQIADLSALAGMSSLDGWDLSHNQIADVSPLAGMSGSLSLSYNRIADVSPLAGASSLTSLGLSNNRISDVSSLAGMSLASLNLSNNRISDVSSLAGMSPWSLGLANNQISDVSPLTGMSSLTDLDLSNNRVADVTPLAAMTSLQTLNLQDNRITDVTALAGMTGLRRLWLSNNRLMDVAPLAEMMSLTNLYLEDNRIADVVPLAGLTSVRVLSLAGNRILDTTPLADMASLSRLDLSDNLMVDVSPLAGLTSLSRLYLEENEIVDVSPLADLTGVRDLRLSNNEIADLSPMAGLVSLSRLHLNNNQIADLSPLAGLSLGELRLNKNEIADVSHLANMGFLQQLYLEDNQIADVTALAGPLAGPYLRELGLGGNRIVDVSPLTGRRSSWLGLWDNRIEDLGPLLGDPVQRGGTVNVWQNPLSEHSMEQHVPALEANGVRVIHAGHEVPFLPIAADPKRQGFVRMVNKMRTPLSLSAATRRIGGFNIPILRHAIDDTGDSRGATRISQGQQSVHFNSDDLEYGNSDKGMSEGTGPGVGGWRLGLYPEDPAIMEVEVSAYMRTSDGFLTAMNAFAPATAYGYRIAFFNPGSNLDQVSTLRLATPRYASANVTIRGVDDSGAASTGAVRVALAAGEARMLTAQQLESGDGVEGALGDGVGKWRLEVTTDTPLQAMSLLESPTGHLTNLSSVPDNATVLPGGERRHRIPLFPAADDAHGRQGFARVVNHGDAAASIRIEAIDDGGARHGPTTLTVPAGATTHFNSDDLEGGNADKGMPSGTGSGTGDWRLELMTDAEIEVLGVHPDAGGRFRHEHARHGARRGGRGRRPRLRSRDLQSRQQHQPGESAPADQRQEWCGPIDCHWSR